MDFHCADWAARTVHQWVQIRRHKRRCGRWLTASGSAWFRPVLPRNSRMTGPRIRLILKVTNYLFFKEFVIFSLSFPSHLLCLTWRLVVDWQSDPYSSHSMQKMQDYVKYELGKFQCPFCTIPFHLISFLICPCHPTFVWIFTFLSKWGE